jgi:16S rRNA (cytidine1402-2'-O)-methyltransferase
MSLGILYLVPNLLGLTSPEEVLPLKTIQIASRIQHFLVETPKPARHFLKTLPLVHPLQSLSIVPLPEKIQASQWDALLAPMMGGEDVGVLSDAGCPGVADPGALVVAEAHRRGVKVVPLVGPSSILLGIMASGFNGQNFRFHGYLPADSEGRIAALKRLQEDWKRADCTHIFIETPYRNYRLIQDMCTALSPRTEVVMAVDLTTPEERILRCTIEALKQRHGEFEPLLNRRPALFLMGAA